MVEDPLSRFNVRMSRPQIERLRKVAEREGIKFTAWARSAIERAVEEAEKAEGGG